LLARSNSAQDADVLEVFGLALLLGYRGRYAENGEQSVQGIVTRITKKVDRIRGARLLAPEWAPTQDDVLHPPPDPWVRPLLLGTLGAVILAVLFFAGYKVALMSGASALHSFSLLAPH
jgi:type VI protein secretion system component VasF